MGDSTILVAADAQWVRDQVRSALVGPGQTVVEVSRGQDVRAAFAQHDPALVILDMQIGNMGGVAVAIDLRLEESAGRLDPATVLLLLDREADRVIAERADADAELVKPVDAGMLRRAAMALLAGNDDDDADEADDHEVGGAEAQIDAVEAEPAEA